MTYPLLQAAMDLRDSGSRRITDAGWTAELRTARKTHWCNTRDDYPAPCLRRIEPGQRYIRSVMFPNHDASGYDIPIVRIACLNCAPNYASLDVLAKLAELTP